MEIKRYVNGIPTEREELMSLSVVTPEMIEAVKGARERAARYGTDGSENRGESGNTDGSARIDG